MNKRVEVLNCPVDITNFESAVNQVDKAVKNNSNFQIITINPEMIMNAQKNKEFLDIIKNSDLNVADGVGVKIALKLKNINCDNIRGVDFARKLVELADKNNLPIAFLGAKEEVIQKACENFKTKYPNLNIVYKRNGYFDNDEAIIEEINKANPKIILIGLGSPKQEEIIVKLKKVLQGSIMIGVGGSFDVYSGFTKESPLIFRKLGLEWLYRTICQPERFKRIFPTLPIFLLKCIMENIGRRVEN